MTPEDQAKGVFAAVQGWLERSIAPFADRLKTLEDREPVNGVDGKDGRDGVDGKDGSDGEKGADGKDGENGRDGIDGRDGREGKDGRDAADLPISIGLDADKSYPMGSFVAAAGGLLRAVRPTSPVGLDGDLEAAGWAVITNGVRGFESELADGGRTLKLSVKMTVGQSEFTHRTAVPVERGVHRDDREYETGDVVAWGGEAWIAEKDAPDGKPGEGEGWRRLVRRGREGKQGPKGEAGSYVRVAK